MDKNSTGHELPLNVGDQHQGVLDQTLGEVLKSNPQAQSVVMQAMHISPDQFQKLLGVTANNNLMNTKIRDLFSSGVVQQAISQQGQTVPADPSQLQLTPEQAAQMQAQGQEGQIVQAPQQQNTSFMQKLKGLLGF